MVGFNQTGPGDENAPRIVSVTANPASVDTSNRATDITVTVHATDDLSGLATTDAARYLVSFRSPSQQSVEGRLRFVSGSAIDSVYDATVTVARYSEQGTWTLSGIGIGDNALNWLWEPWRDAPPSFDVVRTENQP